MKQISKKHLCYWCLGCNMQEDDDYIPKQRCKRVRSFYTGLARKMEKIF